MATLANKFQVVNVKNQSIKDVTFHPFSIVIAKKNSNNEYTTAVNFGYLKNNKEISIYMEIIRYSLAEHELIKEFDELNNYAFQYEKDNIIINNRGFNAKNNYIAKYLRTSCIFITDKDGKICNTVIAKDGILFKDTFLNINNAKGLINRYALFTLGKVTAKDITNDIYTFASKVELQTNYFTRITERVSAFVELCEKEEEPKKETKAKKAA